MPGRPIIRLLLSLLALCLGGLTVLLVGVAMGDPSGSEVLELHLDTITTSGSGTVPSGSTPDSSGNNLSAQAQGSLVTGRFGKALDLSAGSAAATVTDNPLLEPTSAVTVVAWVKDAATPGDLEELVGKGFGDSQCHSQSYDLTTGYQGGILFNVITGGANGGNVYSPEGNPSVPWDGKWHAIAGTYDGNEISLYEDGSLVGSTQVGTNVPLSYGTSGNDDLYVGWEPSYGNCSGTAEKFNGQVDEVRVYDRALSAAQIATLQDPNATTPPEIAGSTGTTTSGTTTTGTTTTGTTTTGTTTTGTTTTGTTATGTGTTTAPPPSGQWYEIGSSASTVNHSVTADAMEPVLAAASGTPYLAWTEDDSVAGSLATQARVASLGSSPLESRPWNELLSPNPGYTPPSTTTTTTGTDTTTTPQQSPTAFSLNFDPSDNATHTHVAISGGLPYAAWIEPDSAGQGQVHVQSWNGTGWSDVGGLSSLNMSTADQATNVSIADVRVNGQLGNLFVAWTETVNGVTELFGKLWNGTSWTQLTAGAISGAGAQVTALQANDALNGPTVVWTQDAQGSSSGTVQLASYSANQNGQGPAWVAVPGPISDTGSDADSPSAANVIGHIVVAFHEFTPATQNTRAADKVFVKEDTASGWTTVGGSPLNSIGQAIEPNLVATTNTTDPRLWLAYVFRPVESQPYQLHTATYDWYAGGAWDDLGVLNHDVRAVASDPSIVDAAVDQTGSITSTTPTGPPQVPVVAWTEPDSAGHEQVHSAAFGTPPTNTALPSLSGTPQNGDQLTCHNGAWTVSADISGQPTRYTDVWERGARTATTNSDPSWAPIPGATGSTYTVQAADDGLRIRCRVVASDGVVSAQAYTVSLETDAGPPTLNDISYPRVVGTPQVGNVLTCDTGPLVSDPNALGWHNNPDFTYFWLKNGQVIDGATGATYTPRLYRYSGGGFTIPDGDGDHDITCGVHAANGLGSTTADSVAVHVYDGAPYVVGGGGAPQVTQIFDDPAHPSSLAETLSCSTGQWIESSPNPVYAYQWLRNETPIEGATGQTYRVTVQDLGRELSCEVTNTNPVINATSQESESDETLIPIPPSTNPSDTVSIEKEGAANQVDPTNLLPVTARYRDAIDSYTIAKLDQGIVAATATCKTEAAAHNWPGFRQSPKVNNVNTEESRCRVLLGDASHVKAFAAGGVRWLDGDCNSRTAQVLGISEYAYCPDMQIQVTPIDPNRPPALSGDELASVGPSSPVEILWDLNNDGKTDAICPGSAPVLSTIFNYDSSYDPHVTIIDQDGTVSSGDLRFALGTGKSYGELRSSQVRVCETSLDPPPSDKPNLPCVTSGQIGSLKLSNANLCPIDARQIDPTDFGTLLPNSLQGYLLAASEGQLASDGTITDRRERSRPDGGPASISYVNWPTRTEPSVRVAIRPARGLHAHDIGQAIATGSASARTIAATTASSLASFTSINSPAKYPSLTLAPSTSFSTAKNGLQFATFRGLSFLFNSKFAPLAYDQIYVARGPGGTSASDAVQNSLDQASAAANSIVPGVTGDTGEAMLNGVGLSAAPIQGQASGMLLIGSDVGGALPDVKSFTLTGRNIASTMGLPTDCTSVSTCQAVALGEAHAYTTQLKDDLTQQGKDAATQALKDATGNLDQMTQDYQNDAKAYGQQLLDRVKNSLDVGPFKFSGDAHVDMNPDGTATLTVDASLPGLTGSGTKTDAQGKPVLDDDGNPVPMDGSPINGRAVFHADLQGHLALRGVHITAPAAFFLGISLKGLDLNYDSNTGFDLKAQILVQALGNAGIDIKNFQLDKNGKFQDLAVDYLAGAGTGIPVFPGIELTQLGFDLNTAKSKFAADVGVTVGTSVGAGCVPLGAVGTVTIQLYQPVEVSGDVSPQIFCLPFGDITFDARGDGSVSLTGNWGLHTDLVDFDIALGAMFAHGDFQIYAHGDGDIIGILKGYLDAVLSNRGVAACGSIDVTIPIVGDIYSIFSGTRTIHIAAGAAEDFSSGIPLTPAQIYAGLRIFTGCDISRYYPLGKPSFSAHRATPNAPATSQQSFRLPAGGGPSLISFTGVGAAPRFTLISPSGQHYDLTQSGTYGSRLAHGAWGSVVPQASETVIIVPKAAGGVWTAQLAAGSPQILNVSHAAILPPPEAKAHVTGRGAQRVLHYTLIREPGQTVQLSEQATGEDHVLKTIGAAHQSLASGKLTYTLGEARSNARRIVAEFFQNGLPRRIVVLSRYSAPNPSVGAPQHLRVKRRGTRALITWRPGALDHTYYVRVSYGDGRKLLGITAKGRLLTQQITRNEGLSVSVYATSPASRPSHPATARLAGSMRVGSVTQLKPYTAPKPKAIKPTPISSRHHTKKR